MLLLGLALSCTQKDSDYIVVNGGKTLYQVDSRKGSIALDVEASGPWRLIIITEDNSSEIDWVWFKDFVNHTEEGSLIYESEDNSAVPVVNYSQNHSGGNRECRVRAESGSATAFEFTIKQSRPAQQEGTQTSLIKEDPRPMWMELPAADDHDCFFIKHESPLPGAPTFRNYSLYMSRSHKVAKWVAYPLNRWTISSGVGRTNDWNLDPRIPRANQPVIFSAFSNSGTYARGHQIPSADRYADGANQQTFYGSNMTPQRHDFNSYIWAKLEGAVRNWSGQFDTLYVVTGCNTLGAKSSVRDNDGKEITVPTGYFKALLGLKKTVKTPGYTGTYSGIAFYFDHKSYPNTNAELNNHRMSIAQLESIVGMDFFSNLPDVVGAAEAMKIETANEDRWKL